MGRMAEPFRVMGIVNVTPDSFSDGGLFLDADAAIEHGLALVGEGADIVDVGGESTRPGAEPVAAERERERVQPVVEGLAAARSRAQISIDTSKASVAQAALSAGADIVNDVTALRGDAEMAGVIADAGVECCLMHMLGEPRTMQRDPRYEDVVDEVKAFLSERLEFAVREGVSEERVMLDPGIGFGKTVAHNLELLRRLDELAALGRPLVIGTSRKTFIGVIGAREAVHRAPSGVADAGAPSGSGDVAVEPLPVDERLAGTIATNVLAYERGASVFRVHDVAPVRAALALAAATLGAQWPQTTRGRTPTS
jgi:dihydropteroate synthase